MKKTTTAAIFPLILLVMLCGFTVPMADVFKVDSTKSKIAWTGQNIAGGKHTGTIGISKGELTVDGNSIKAGSFTVAINSIKVTDLTGDRAERLTNHLKNEDFFDAPKFPEAIFKITKVSGTGKNVTVTGDLTIKDITKSISFPAVIQQSDNAVQATAKGVKIDRTQFDIKYRSGNFFSGLGDKAISDEFMLDIEIVASK